jgi:hypothetical protein
MLASAVVYTGAVVTLLGVIAAVRPRRRRSALAVAASGVAIAAIGFLLPAPESRIRRAVSQLDRFMPAWQFNEVHTIDIAAPPERVFAAIRSVRADEIFLFRTLTWIRRGGRDLPEGILNAGERESLIDVALKGGFITLADDAPHELVIGTIVVAPRRGKPPLTPALFEGPVPRGTAIAAMNFAVAPNGSGGSRVTTETRVFANGDRSRASFARYWRVIYPGSALIRRMWLRAVNARAIG